MAWFKLIALDLVKENSMQNFFSFESLVPIVKPMEGENIVPRIGQSRSDKMLGIFHQYASLDLSCWISSIASF